MYVCMCAQDQEGKQQLQQIVAKELEVNKPQQQASVVQVIVHYLACTTGFSGTKHFID